MVSVDVSVFFQIVNFLLLIMILNLVLYRPIRNILAKRQEKINGLENNISSCYDDATNGKKSIDEKLNKARIDGIQKKDSLTQEALEEEKRIIGEINTKNLTRLNEIKEKVGKETVAAREKLSNEIQSFAEAISEKILGRAV